jgi:hypothetical protein
VDRRRPGERPSADHEGWGFERLPSAVEQGRLSSRRARRAGG